MLAKLSIWVKERPWSVLCALVGLNLVLRTLFFTGYVNSDLVDYILSAQRLLHGVIPHSNPFPDWNDHFIRFGVIIPYCIAILITHVREHSFLTKESIFLHRRSYEQR